MNEKHYIMIIEDRHCDVEVKLYRGVIQAIGAATDFALCHTSTPDDYTEIELTKNMKRLGWVYRVEYSCESDCVTVVEVEVQS